MLALTSEQQEALAQRVVMRRDFIWCVARDPDTGDPVPVGFWNDIGTVEIAGRTYVGSGPIIQIGTLSAKGDASIPGLTVTLSGLKAEVAALIRGEVVGQAPIEVLLGIFDVESRLIIPPLIPRFSGFIDDIDINTDPGGAATVVLTCESTSRALTRKSTVTRSDASSRPRDPNDGFYKYTGAQRTKPLFFGRPG